MPLNDRQSRFVEEYLVDLNATQAAIRAGYAKGSADVTANRLLGNKSVREEIERRKAARSVETGITANQVLKELASIAFLDPDSIFDFSGNEVAYRPANQIPEAARRAIAGFRYSKDGVLQEIKLWSKEKALELIGRHIGMFLEKLELTEKVKMVVTEEIVDAEDSPANGEAAPGPGGVPPG